ELEFELKIHKIVIAHKSKPSPRIIDAGIEDQRSEQVDSRSRSTSIGKNNLERSKERERDYAGKLRRCFLGESNRGIKRYTEIVDHSSSGCSTEVEKGSKFSNKIK
ncbi:unnamed protein product, partial [Brassica rapa subsp. narinosa]